MALAGVERDELELAELERVRGVTSSERKSIRRAGSGSPNSDAI